MKRATKAWFALAVPVFLFSIGAGLADPAPLTGADVLADGFEAGRFSPKGGLYYKDNAEQRAGTVLFQSSNVHSGKSALTLSVKPLCKAGLKNCSERAEVWERSQVLAPYDQTLWYGFAIRLDEPVPRDSARHVVAQWKREIIPGAEGDYSPFLALRLYRGRLGFTVETDRVQSFRIGGPERPHGCREFEARVLDRPGVLQTRALVATEGDAAAAAYPAYFDACAPDIRVTRHADLPAASKGWIDFVIRSQPGPTGTGHITIIADGVLIATVRGHIGHRGLGLDKNQYFKFGPYRAAATTSWAVSFDDFRRGPRCADVMRGGECPQD